MHRETRTMVPAALGHALLAAVLAALLGPAPAGATAVGDTLTVIQRPLLNIPTIVIPGSALPISCSAAPGTTGWSARLERGPFVIPLAIESASYDASTLWWTLNARIPDAQAIPLFELYDLVVEASGGLADRTQHAVNVIPEYRTTYYIAHITDPHLPTSLYYYETGAATDSSELMDLRAVLADLDVIHPEFIALTGDLVNEGELEDFLLRRYYTRGQRALAASEIPVCLSAGNHDLGGWDDTPPPAGTARRDWWRFFGWKRLDSPPPGAPWYTQDYSFDYGTVHYTFLESYDNYHDWRYPIYGATSFIASQLQWLSQDLARASNATARVLFHHYDFAGQLDLAALNVDCALWGHIHSDQGNLNLRPFDLSTNNTGNGERSYRLIRVIEGGIFPLTTLNAGSGGERLRVTWSPANDGTHETVTAQVVNQQTQHFQNGLLKFRMPPGPGTIQVTGGTLAQAADSADIGLCYVNVDILSSSTQTVTVVKTPSAVGDEEPAPRARLWLSGENPFLGRAEIGFALAQPGRVRLTILAPDGREIARLVEGAGDAGAHAVSWDGTDAGGARVPAGVYFARLDADGAAVTRKIILAR